jgi:hypothetical protein
VNVDIEDRLAALLAHEAEAAPPAGDLLLRVHARSRQRSRRRLGLISIATVVAVVGTAALVQNLAGSGASRRAPSLFASPGSSDVFTTSFAPLTVPVKPGWLPLELAVTPHASFGQSGYHLSFRKEDDDQLLGIDIWLADHDISLKGDGVTRRPTTVNGHPGVLATTDGEVSLTWQPAAGEWLSVNASNNWSTEAIARHVATTLVRQPLEVRPPFDMRLFPRDSELAEWTTDSRVVFVPRGQQQRWRDGGVVAGALQIAVRRSTAELEGHGDAVTVRERPGWLLTESTGRKRLVVQLTDAVALVVDAPAWSTADVLRLAEGISYDGGLPPAEG